MNMTPKKTAPQRTNGDSFRWGSGLLVLAIGLYAAASVLFSWFHWEEDQSLLQQSADEKDIYGDDVANLCGKLGVRIAKLLVDDSFGVFGILLPVLVALLGVRILRQRPLLLNYSSLLLLMTTFLGSLTLGVIFGDRWSLCASTGWGGAFGIAIGEKMMLALGGLGVALVLGLGWILLGVFINRNFINTVNSVGHAMMDQSERIVDSVRQKVTSATPAATSEPQPDEERPVEATADLPDENPFVTVSVSESAPEPAPKSMDEQSEEYPFKEPEEESPFTAVDLSNPEARVVMGAGGLVELEQRPQSPAIPADNPFTEIVLNEPQPEPAEPVAPTPQSEPQGVVVTVETHEDNLLSEKKIPTESYDPTEDLANYHRPPVKLLEDYISDSEVTDEEIYENKTRIEETLKNFGIPIQRIKATVGPTVTLYEIVQAQGIKIAKVQGLENDIAQSLKALGIRIIAPIPGKGTIGIEVPNRNKQVVSMYSAIRSVRFQESKAELPVVIGRTIQNENYVFDLAKLPHLLVAGATGQGKSVGLNAIITSLLYRKHPSQLKFVMIDPKMVEFSLYAKLEKHFLAKMESEDEAIITDPKKAVYTLNALCLEMDNRLELCKKAGARNIAEYNEKFTARRLNPNNGHRYLPYIVVVVDEFADLIMTAKEVEGPVMRLAQKARAIGIHLIIATQRPDVKVITGGIKANFPARIAFRVMQMIDSRTIIDQPGANQLIGRGDMLFSKDGDLTRIQCALVETKEVERICDHIAKQQGYFTPYLLPDYTPESGAEGMGSVEESSAPMKYDALFAEIARDAVTSGQISTSMIQRNYEVGFNRAGRIMLQLERAGIVGRQQGAKPRDILFYDLPSLEQKLQSLGLF